MNRLLLLTALIVCRFDAAIGDDERKYLTRVYPVADLVVDGPAENSQLLPYFRNAGQAAMAVPTPEANSRSGELSAVPGNLRELAQIIEALVAGDHEASVAPYTRTRSLVVRASTAAHDDIVSALEDLRKSGLVTIEFTIECIEPTHRSQPAEIQQTSLSESESQELSRTEDFLESWIAQHGRRLTPESMTEFRQQMTGNGYRFLPITSGTVRSGYSRDCLTAESATIVTATATADRRHVRTVLTQMLGEALSINTTLQIPDGHGVLQDFSFAEGETFPCLITAAIQIVEEEEEVFTPPHPSRR